LAYLFTELFIQADNQNSHFDDRKIADKLIHPNQTAFMKGRNIMSGILILHEMLHETKRKK
jgi:hypothetical protein